MTFIPKYSAWRDAFDNEKIYTRRDMANALTQQRRELELAATVLGVMRLLPNDDQHMMVLHRVERHPEGVFIVVR
jgi:hypothetical protein